MEQFHEDAIFAVKHNNITLLNLLLLQPNETPINEEKFITHDTKMREKVKERNIQISTVSSQANMAFVDVGIDWFIFAVEMFLSEIRAGIRRKVR